MLGGINMAKTWSDFADLMRPSIMGCPDLLMEDYVKRAVIDFANETHIMRADADDVVIVADTASYTLTFTGSEVTPIYILNVKFGDNTLYETSENELDAHDPDWRHEEGTPTHRFQTPDNKMVLYPVPDSTEDDDLEVECVVKPTTSATGVDDYVFDDFGYVIAEGALADLKRIPGKPWTDPAAASFHYALYKKGISKARRKVMKSKGLSSSYVNPKSFGGID
jgi:hypothetical protein